VRTVFLVLLSANLLFLAWTWWIDTPQSSTQDAALSRMPRLQLVSETPTTKPAGSAQKMALHGVEPLPRKCVSVGPFNEIGAAAGIAGMLHEQGFNPRQRAEEGETLDGYWVFVGGLDNATDVEQALQKLEKNGFTDAHVMKASPAGRRISVGLFSRRERAERRAAAVQKMGLEPEVAERRFPGTIYWVDVMLHAGEQTVPISGVVSDGDGAKEAVHSCPPGVAPPPPPPGTEPSDEAPDDGDGITRSLPRTTVASAPTGRP
jgi:hypothetical protein